ncbi:DUF485 domain-containing protein [Arsenicicoccus piscis]|uniref:Membrane protein n=1 Tax=Arsenicicoccus piscis TaxID=673954 RepID=A0ABQ6HTY0_9MICO|nr:DUF485 domain-containing protein [Arsenicicoccus piscis]MCH8627587.1 DUF485 domain-containing protein [Arsenicicoccus piscis]GMA18070.1 membrane protein [Arsenicicoccus piscis]GMA21939.1 membrane protein [Arsenicicoccus piscis]
MSATRPPADRAAAYAAVQRSPEFTELRSKLHRFVFPTTAFFLAWYFLYVLLAAFAPGFMSTRVVGNINIGLIFGLLQFVTTFAITIAYIRWADRQFDPRAAEIHTMVEREIGGDY